MGGSRRKSSDKSSRQSAKKALTRRCSPTALIQFDAVYRLFLRSTLLKRHFIAMRFTRAHPLPTLTPCHSTRKDVCDENPSKRTRRQIRASTGPAVCCAGGDCARHLDHRSGVRRDTGTGTERDGSGAYYGDTTGISVRAGRFSASDMIFAKASCANTMFSFSGSP